jgi:hypothetical protein
MKGRVSGVESAELNMRITEMASQGMGSREIGDELGYHARMIAARVTRLRKAKDIPPAIDCRKGRDMRTILRNLCQNYGKNLGRLTQVMERLTEEQIIWVFRETPEGSTVAELIAALIRDAYDEETGNG